ncbi:MAG: hypothetical protein ABIR57_00040 [Aeromicrobium sp.]
MGARHICGGAAHITDPGEDVAKAFPSPVVCRRHFARRYRPSRHERIVKNVAAIVDLKRLALAGWQTVVVCVGA